MDDALTVGAVERHAALENDADDAVHRQQLVDTTVFLEAETVDVLHRHVGKVIFDRGVIDANDVRVIETLRDHALVLEQLAHPPRHRGAVLTEADDLDRHLAAAIRIVAQVHRGRGALAQFPDDPVFAYLLHAVAVINRMEIS